MINLIPFSRYKRNICPLTYLINYVPFFFGLCGTNNICNAISTNWKSSRMNDRVLTSYKVCNSFCLSTFLTNFCCHNFTSFSTMCRQSNFYNNHAIAAQCPYLLTLNSLNYKFLLENSLSKILSS
jgi:hypothetical protein